MSNYASANQAYTASAIMTAPPGQLVVMLYDGAIRFLRQGSVAMRNGNREVSLNRIQRAGAIINELNLSLDMSYGDVPAGLRSIYAFSRRHLNDALVTQDPDKIDHVVKLLSDLREAWVTIASQPEPAAETAAAS